MHVGRGKYVRHEVHDKIYDYGVMNDMICENKGSIKGISMEGWLWAYTPQL